MRRSTLVNDLYLTMVCVVYNVAQQMGLMFLGNKPNANQLSVEPMSLLALLRVS